MKTAATLVSLASLALALPQAATEPTVLTFTSLSLLTISSTAPPAPSVPYSNPNTQYLTQTDSNGVITGMPSVVTSQAGAVTNQPNAVTSQPAVDLVPAGLAVGHYDIPIGNTNYIDVTVGTSATSTFTSILSTGAFGTNSAGSPTGANGATLIFYATAGGATANGAVSTGSASGSGGSGSASSASESGNGNGGAATTTTKSVSTTVTTSGSVASNTGAANKMFVGSGVMGVAGMMAVALL